MIVQKTNNLVSIDILRGISAIGVAVFHSRVDAWVGFREIRDHPTDYSIVDRTLSWLSLPVSQLGSLVMLFFVISGFCIHLPYAKSNASMNLRTYAIRRFWRIYPPYLVTILGGLFLEFILNGSDSLIGQLGIAGASAGLFQNYLFFGGQMSSNPSLWSIPIEVELYVAYALTTCAIRWLGVGVGFAWVVTGFCALAAFFLTKGGWPFLGFSFVKYWPIWWSGAWLAERWQQGQMPSWKRCGRWIFFASLLIIVCQLFWDADFAYIGWGFFSFALLWWCLEHNWSPTAWTWRALAGIGLFSYSLYLIHFPCLRAFGELFQAVYGQKPSSFLVPVIATALCLPIAWLFYQWIELPCHRLGKRLADGAGSR